jgi:hypothetical protein
MLHYLDDLDSKMEAMRAQFVREAELPGAWTSYNPSLGRPLLNSKRFLEPKPQHENVPEMQSQAAAAAAGDGDLAEPFTAMDSSSHNSNGADSQPAVEVQMELAATQVADSDAAASPLEALQQKFASHKVTAVDRKGS